MAANVDDCVGRSASVGVSMVEVGKVAMRMGDIGVHVRMGVARRWRESVVSAASNVRIGHATPRFVRSAT